MSLISYAFEQNYFGKMIKEIWQIIVMNNKGMITLAFLLSEVHNFLTSSTVGSWLCLYRAYKCYKYIDNK